MLSDLHVRYLLVPVLAFVAQASDTGYLADFWHHLGRGEVMVQSGELLDHDRFTFTVHGQPFQDVNWLSQCLYAWLFQAGGLALVQTVNALVLAIMLGLFVHLCRRQAGSLVLAMAVGLAVFLGLWHVLTIRPQSFSLLLFVVFLGLLERSAAQPWLLVFIPPLQGLWANLHGAFPAGILLIGCFGLAELVRAVRDRTWTRQLGWLSCCLAAAVLATLANPYGLRIYEYVGLTSQRAATRGIDEWLPPSLDQWIGLAFFISLGVLAIVLVAAWRRRGHVPSVQEVILLACFLPLAATSIRMVAWWLIVVALPLSRALAALVTQARDTATPPSFAASATVFGLLFLALFSVPWLAAANPLLSWKNQGRVEDCLQLVHERLNGELDKGRIFTRLEWGEYLGRVGCPDFPVFMDGRIEIYPDEVWLDFAQITQAQAGWQETLARHQVNVLVLDREYHARFGLISQVEASGAWSRLCEAGPAIVFVRR